jgi:2-keto-4-pentenoate hydratase
MHPTFEQLSRSLAEAWRTCATVPLPPAEAAPRSRADAFAIQDRMAEILGDRCVGWKVGAGVRAVQILEGHDGPILGRLFASRLYTSPASVPKMFDGYNIECEYALRFEVDVPPRSRPYTRAELERSIVLQPGIEIAGTRYDKEAASRKLTTHDAIADNGTGGAYVVGPAIERWREIDLATLAIDGRVDGGEPIHTYTGEYRRDPVDIAIETVNAVCARGFGFAAGDLLSTGSLTLPTPLRVAQTYVARFGDLATVSVTIAR